MAFAKRILLLHAFYVLFGARIDLNAVAGINKEGHAHFYAAIERSRFERVGGGIAFEAGLGIGDFSFNVGGQFNREHHIIIGIEHDEAHHTIFEEIGRIDEVFLHRDLLVCFIVHEVVPLIIAVEVLVFARFNTYGVDFGARVERVVNDLTGIDTFEFGADKCSAFAWFYVKKFNDLPDVVVVSDAQPISDIRGIGHGGDF